MFGLIAFRVTNLVFEIECDISRFLDFDKNLFEAVVFYFEGAFAPTIRSHCRHYDNIGRYLKEWLRNYHIQFCSEVGFLKVGIIEGLSSKDFKFIGCLNLFFVGFKVNETQN